MRPLGEFCEGDFGGAGARGAAGGLRSHAPACPETGCGTSTGRRAAEAIAFT